MSTPEQAPASPLILGTMGWGDVGASGDAEAARERARGALRAGLAAGITLLDTADIYGAGASEETVGALLAELDPADRAGLRVQTKAGIVLHERGADGAVEPRYDSSPAYLRSALAASLRRLGVDSVDTLVIHRPDVLTPVQDTVRAFLDAREAGLVTGLGVSNLGTGRLLAFQRELRRTAADGTGLACAQLELGLHHRALVEAVVLANHDAAPATAGVADLGRVCAEEGVELQAWGPLGQGRYTRDDTPDGDTPDGDAAGGAADGPAAVAGASAVVAELAAELGTSREAVVLAWLLRLPWGVRPVIGSQDSGRIAACAQAPDAAAALDSRRWHRLWSAARGVSLP